MSRSQDFATILGGSNAAYLRELYASYLNDPSSVSKEWRAYFETLTRKKSRQKRVDSTEPPIENDALLPFSVRSYNALRKQQSLESPLTSSSEAVESIQGALLTQAYQMHGHLAAQLNPFSFPSQEKSLLEFLESIHPFLDPKTYGFQDLNGSLYGGSPSKKITLSQLIKELRSTYCGTVAAEFMHITDPFQRQWIQTKMEKRAQEQAAVSKSFQKSIFKQLSEAEGLEQFFQRKYPGERRFSLEGSESFIVALEAIIEQSTKTGVKQIVLGMAHRGRLNVMANVFQRPLRELFAYFEKGPVLSLKEEQRGPAAGDVKYHLGYETERVLRYEAKTYRTVLLTLMANPSHLESVNPVVLGKVRAKQALLSETKKEQVLGVLIHGDASFTGQGVVAETLQLATLEGYSTGGTIHLIVNNQLGYTASPKELRSSSYCSDTAKVVSMPIFHVNAQDPEAVAWVSQTASEFRHFFSSDVLIDLIGYRRRGHNETEEPAFTHPLLYKKIEDFPTITDFYQEDLLKKGGFQSEELQEVVATIRKKFQKEFSEFQAKPSVKEEHKNTSKTLVDPSEIKSGVTLKKLSHLGKSLAVLPSQNKKSFHLHTKLERFLSSRTEAAKTGENIDWSFAEALAFSSLLEEGVPIRLSGQDSVRGTFSQRHAVFMDIKRDSSYQPFDHLETEEPKKTASLEILNSPLSEMAILGFEYGYSLSAPQTLVIWEAQFGDFFNGAQVIIDQYLSAGEAKWGNKSGLVLLLPHGFDGLGPEHSSARMERFLQLCAEENMQVANCTTPANYFHILRRQALQNLSGHAKPLILMSPKSLLRHKEVFSSFSEMNHRTAFQPVLVDPFAEPQKTTPVKRVILCSGKIYYDLLEAKKKLLLQKVVLIRLEQLYPFPRLALAQALEPYRHTEIVWCQEEPIHMGAWTFLDRHLQSLLKEIGSKHQIVCIGRPPSASPATGCFRRHQQEQKKILEDALHPWFSEEKEIYGLE